MGLEHTEEKRLIRHSWWRTVRIAFVPGPMTPLLSDVSESLMDYFQNHGHIVDQVPVSGTDVILTTAKFGVPIRWREAMMFTARRRFNMDRTPSVFTIVHATPVEFQALYKHFEEVLRKDPPVREDYSFPGLAPEAYQTLFEQGRRGGPMLSLLRVVQTQAMSIRILLMIGEDRPVEAYTFDLVGAHPRIDAADLDNFYLDILGRIVTATSTHEITAHQVVEPLIPRETWLKLSTPAAMRRAGLELGRRSFFTEMVQVTNLASVPSVPDAISSQYSEGCFATWDPLLHALVTTVTGSARPVDKDNLSDNELAVIIGVRPDGKGALVRHVEGLRNDPPSSEAVELMEMDRDLPKIVLGSGEKVPVSRSKLHGHRSVRVYDPNFVEHVYLNTPYYHYPVSCSTEAQAHAIVEAFSHSEALTNPSDRRQVVFTILPGHGIVIVEKWIPGKQPFEIMWEYMDKGLLQIDNYIPQGPLTFTSNSNGKMYLRTF
jgi:hypothetical protein